MCAGCSPELEGSRITKDGVGDLGKADDRGSSGRADGRRQKNKTSTTHMLAGTGLVGFRGISESFVWTSRRRVNSLFGVSVTGMVCEYVFCDGQDGVWEPR